MSFFAATRTPWRALSWRRFAAGLTGLLLARGAAAAMPGDRWGAAGPSAAPAASGRVTHWTTEDGLPQNSCKALAQTPEGYLWIGTFFGLVRFDGVRFTVFDANNTPALVSDAINALAVDAVDGSLWIGTGKGVVRLAAGHFERFGKEHGLGGVWVLAPSPDGGVWVTPRREELLRIHRGGVARHPFVGDIPEDLARWLRAQAGGELVLGLNRMFGRVTLDAAGNARFQELFRPKGGLCGLVADGRERVWVNTTNGPNEWRGGVQRPLVMPEVAASFSGGGLYRTEPGESLIKSGDHKLFLLEEASGGIAPLNVRVLDETKGMSAALRDREGNLWIGSDYGLYRLTPHRVRVIAKADGLRSEHINSVVEAADGTVWLGTGQGVAFFRQGRIGHLEMSEGRPGQGVSALLPMPDGGLWFNESGRWLWQEGVPRRLTDNENREMGAVLRDRQGRVWLGRGEMVECGDGARTNYFGKAHGLPPFKVRAIHQDRAGAMWFGTYGGLAKLEGARFTTFTTTNGELNNRMWAIHEDGDGVFWIGTQAGLNRFEHGRCFTFTTAHGLHENVINHVLEDEFGYLWFGGLRGIYRVARGELNAIAGGRTNRARCLALGEADGMLSSETNGEHTPAACRTRDGRMWFPTVRGVVIVDPKFIEQQERDTPLPPVVVEDVVVDGAAVQIRHPPPATRDLRLAPGRARVLEIHYTANCFAAPERVRFRYRLERAGEAGAWVDAADRRVAYFTNLRPGAYRFQVAAADHHGRWNEAGASLAFSLAPHFWQTRLFYGLGVLAVCSLAAGVQAYRLRVQRRILRLENQRSLEQERARIARDLHDELGSRLTALSVRAELAGRNGSDDQFRAFADESRALAERMRDVIWAVDPECDSLEALVSRLTEHAEDFLSVAGIRLRLELPDTLPTVPLSADARHQLTMVAKEALHNALKHARAAEVRLRVELRGDELRLRVSDDGAGFGEDRPGGRGLANMRRRLEALGGALEIHSRPGEGTRIEAAVPLRRLAPKFSKS